MDFCICQNVAYMKYRGMHAISRLFLILVGFNIICGIGLAATLAELENAIQKANPGNAENLTVQLEQQGKKKILKVGRKIIVNPLRHVIQVQAVDLRLIEPLPAIDKIGSRTQPWVKLRCKKGRKDVYVTEQVYVEDELNDLESIEEERPVLVIPCEDVYVIEELVEVLASFLRQQ